MWMLVQFLAVDLPGKVYVKDWSVLESVVVSIEWVVEMVQYGCWKREVASGMCQVMHSDLTVPTWLVVGRMLVQSIWFPESVVACACIVK